MFKRYSQYSGGTCDPLVIHWPRGIKAKGEVRHQYHHSTDIVPTILDVTGLEMPTTYRGVEQYPLNGVSMRYSFDDADAPTQEAAPVLRDAGHPRHLGGRLEGRRAARADSAASGTSTRTNGSCTTSTRTARSRKDLAAEHPEKLKELDRRVVRGGRQELRAAARRPHARSSCSTIERPQSEPPRNRYIYYPDTAPVPEGVAVNIRGRSYKIIADVDITDEAARRDLRARLTLRRPRAVHQGPQAVLRLQLPRHQARAGVRVRRS